MSQTKTIEQILIEIRKFSPNPDRVKLLAVSKKQSVEKIQLLLKQEQFRFGENYVQEALEKIEMLPKTIEWHLIGHLQSKKVNSIVGQFAYIHSIDSLKIAEMISNKSKSIGIVQKIFVEVNMGLEASKSGFSIDSIKANWPNLCDLDGIKICGLMTLPPPSEDMEITRRIFKSLKELQNNLQDEAALERHPMNELSMGTSQDYAIALQEGSTCIRIGTILFGERL